MVEQRLVGGLADPDRLGGGARLAQDALEVDVLEARDEGDGPRPRALEQIAHLVGAEARVDGDGERAEAGEREVQLQPLGAVGQPQRHAVAGADAGGGQPAREAGGAVRELRGGDRAVVEDQRCARPTGELPQQARQRLGLPPAHDWSVPRNGACAVAGSHLRHLRWRYRLGMETATLLEAARHGDEGAFVRLVEPHRRELHAHCYRMLGSLHDAEDAFQDAQLRAWRGIPRFDGRSSLRTWLYRIATNTSLDVIGKRPERTLPIDHGPPSDPFDGPGEPLVETVWIEPYPDEQLGLEDGYAAPDARYEARESVELAFVAAVQHLPANQRAVLLMREVLGFSAREVAESLDTTVASVNSALQRARKTIEEKMPAESQQATLRALGDRKVGEIVNRYMDALGAADVDAVVDMLAEEAAWSMPPAATWYRGATLPDFLRVGPLSGAWRWRHLPAHVNGQAAVGVYAWDEASGTHLPFALDVLTLQGDRIKEVTAFIVRTTDLPDREAFKRWPEQPLDERRSRRSSGAPGCRPRWTERAAQARRSASMRS